MIKRKNAYTEVYTILQDLNEEEEQFAVIKTVWYNIIELKRRKKYAKIYRKYNQRIYEQRKRTVR